MTNCKNCNAEVALNYCPNCGVPSRIKRIDGHYVAHEIEHVLHFERGILYTIRELLLKPGENVRHYISENRSRLVKPIIFIIITSLIYSIASHFFHIEQEYVEYKDTSHSTTGLIFKWVQEHYGYGNIIMALFIAFWIKLFFKKYGYNYFEILILLCFAMGMGMLILAFMVTIQGLTKLDLMQVGGAIGILYCTWAIGQFFDKKKVANYFKALVAYILGMGSFAIITIVIGTIIDLIVK
ncbi:DUF3667 domain-containing protein [Pedobacter duraquae]|nr:DUF3667 domain-containing protein [Pedobacter duraquae]